MSPTAIHDPASQGPCVSATTIRDRTPDEWFGCWVALGGSTWQHTVSVYTSWSTWSATSSPRWLHIDLPMEEVEFTREDLEALAAHADKAPDLPCDEDDEL